MGARSLSSEPDQGGQGLVEYALLVVLVSILVIGVLAILGRDVAGALDEAVAALEGRVVEEELPATEPPPTQTLRRWDPRPDLRGHCRRSRISGTVRYRGPEENRAAHNCQ